MMMMMMMLMVVLRMMAGHMQAGIFPSMARPVVRHLGTRSRIYLACDRPVERKRDDDVLFLSKFEQDLVYNYNTM